MELSTTSPNCFIYKTEELLIELLGDVRIEGLDRMRVTIKVTVVNRKHAGYLTNPELADLSIRHNLDLYNDTQVEKFVRRVAEKLETGSIALIYKGYDGHDMPVGAILITFVKPFVKQTSLGFRRRVAKIAENVPGTLGTHFPSFPLHFLNKNRHQPQSIHENNNSYRLSFLEPKSRRYLAV